MEKIKYLTSKEVAEILGVTEDCIRKWDTNGKLKPDLVTDGGHRRYFADKILSLKKGGAFSEDILDEMRKVWAAETVMRLKKVWVERTKVYSFFDDGCVNPVISFKSNDEIRLGDDGFIVESKYFIDSDKINLANGLYITDMIERYRRFSQINEGGCIPDRYIDDINNLWGFLNWEFYFSEDGKNINDDNRINGSEFMETLLNDNYSGVFSWINDDITCLQKFSKQIKNDFSNTYNRYMERFGRQVWVYVEKRRLEKKWKNNEDGSYKERVRRMFKEGDYGYIRVEHDGYAYNCDLGNRELGYIEVQIDNNLKFDTFMKRLNGASISCTKTKQVSMVDDLIDVNIVESDKEEKINFSENPPKFTESQLTIEREPSDYVIEYAKCPYCGGMLKSKTPTLYNPFNFEGHAICECEKCNRSITTEHAYPRVRALDKNGEVINTYE